MGLVRTCIRWKPRKVCYTRKKPKRTRVCKKVCASYRTKRGRR